MNCLAQALHPYDGLIPLTAAGYFLGTLLVLVHAIALIYPRQTRQFLLSSSRNNVLAQVVLAIDLFWFFLLIAPNGLGVLSSLRVGLAEFEGVRWLLQLACPVFLILMVVYVKNLLFPRALGIFLLLLCAPLLSAAYLQDSQSRLLIPIWCYTMIFLGLIWIGKPYLYRNWVQKLCNHPKWWVPLCSAGLCYGIAVLICTVLWW